MQAPEAFRRIALQKEREQIVEPFLLLQHFRVGVQARPLMVR